GVPLVAAQPLRIESAVPAADFPAAVARLQKALAGRPPALRQAPPQLFLRRTAKFEVAPQPAPSVDDGALHLAIAIASPDPVLAPGLTIETVQSVIGPPDSTARQTIQNGFERRPVVLRLYRYAGGAIAFATSS